MNAVSASSESRYLRSIGICRPARNWRSVSTAKPCVACTRSTGWITESARSISDSTSEARLSSSGVESRRDALVGPGESLAERRQLRAAAALARDERMAERAFAVAQQSPRIAIGQARRAAGGRERAGLLDADQERGQARNQRSSVLPAQLPMGVDRDLEHGFPNVSLKMLRKPIVASGSVVQSAAESRRWQTSDRLYIAYMSNHPQHKPRRGT